MERVTSESLARREIRGQVHLKRLVSTCLERDLEGRDVCASAIQALTCKCLQREELCVKMVCTGMQRSAWVEVGIISTHTCWNVQSDRSKVNC